MTVEKRRFIGPGGGVFVPNVDDDTIALRVESGEWVPVEAPKATKATRASKASK